MNHSVFFPIATLSLVAWLYLLLGRGGFWRANRMRPDDFPAGPGPAPGVVVVIPARDEAATIGRTVTSLLRQDYATPLSVVVVDDGSRDGTAKAARRAAAQVPDGKSRLHILTGRPLPDGWSGKVWAMDQGIRHAASTASQVAYILLTDADIEHDASNVGILVAMAEAGHLDLVSLMVHLRNEGEWARLLIPAFIFFFQKLFPFAWVNDPGRATAAAAGGCMLVRAAALDRAGGMESIRGHLIDDCALARRIKRQGAIWLGLTTKVRSLRPYDGLSDIWRMVTRTAYEQLHHSLGLVLLSVVGMAVVYLAPPLCVIAGLAAGDIGLAATGGLAWLLMAIAYCPTLRLYGEPLWQSATLPVAGLLYSLMTIDSARRSWRGKGGGWKGRAYPRTGQQGDDAGVSRV